MEDFGLADVLMDDEELATAGNDEDACPICESCTSTKHPWRANASVAFPRRNKDEFCHAVHLLVYGEQLWAVA